MEQKKLQALIEKANSGDAQAQNELGEYYEMEGHDPEAAFEWLSKSSEQGNMEAMYSLACFYEEGTGVEQNEEKAFEIYKYMADKRFETRHEKCFWACGDLADYYKEGRVVEQDLKKSMEWLEAATEYESGVFPEKNECLADYLRENGGDEFKIAGLYWDARRMPAYEKLLQFYFKQNADPDKASCCSRIMRLISRQKYIHFFHGGEDVGMDYEDYWLHQFQKDLRKYYRVEPGTGGVLAMPFVMVCSSTENCRKLYFKSLQHYLYFSISVFFMSLFPQVLGEVCDAEIMDKFHLCSGWPKLLCGMGGLMSPITVIEDSGLAPDRYRIEEYVYTVKKIQEYQLEEFITFLKGNQPNLDHEKYAQLCEALKHKIQDVRMECEIQTEVFKNWIWNDNFIHKSMLVGYDKYKDHK